jgi:hypothetical protein
VAGWESVAAPLVREPPDLDRLAVDQLAAEWHEVRELELANRQPPSPERDYALRELAVRQLAEATRDRG